MSESAVIIDLAYAWNCPHCGHRNYAESVIAEITPEEKENHYEQLGCITGEVAKTGDWVTHPDEDDCGKCGRTISLLGKGQKHADYVGDDE